MSENESVVNAESGEPEKKLVVVRSAIKLQVSNGRARRGGCCDALSRY